MKNYKQSTIVQIEKFQNAHCEVCHKNLKVYPYYDTCSFECCIIWGVLKQEIDEIIKQIQEKSKV